MLQDMWEKKFYNHGVLSCRGMDSRLGVLEDDGGHRGEVIRAGRAAAAVYMELLRVPKSENEHGEHI